MPHVKVDPGREGPNPQALPLEVGTPGVDILFRNKLRMTSHGAGQVNKYTIKRYEISF